MDDDRPTPPIRITSVRDKNGPTSSSDKKEEKKKGWFGGKNKSGR